MSGKKKRLRAAPPSTAGERLPVSRPGEKAVEAFQKANGFDAIPRLASTDDIYYRGEAERLRKEGRELLHLDRPVATGGGEMVIRDDKADEARPGAHFEILETLEDPNSVSVGASKRRMYAAQEAGVLEPAVDAAVSVQAANSIERMLAHQLAAVHIHSLKLLQLSTGAERLHPLQPGEVARFTNAAARLMDVYQQGCLTLLKLKNRGAQRVEVQYLRIPDDRDR
jgi:hypothetical protein